MLDSGVELRDLPLTPEEGFVASRLDGSTDLHGLSIVTGLSAERVEAAHHRTPSGLEALAARAAFAADAGVRRALLRNPQLPAGLLRRLHGGRRLLEQHKLVVSRDVPEQTRRAAREILRARFSTAEADERVEVIVKTEGRCLTSLAGLPVDGKTAALLCGRIYRSPLLLPQLPRS